MKLYNRTEIPDDLLRPVLLAAGRAAGAKTAKVLVRVTRGRRYTAHGSAADSTWAKHGWLIGKHRRNWGERKVRCDGVVRMIVGRIGPPGWDGLVEAYRATAGIINSVWERWSPEIAARMLARNVYRVAVHEAHHIREYHEGRLGPNIDYSSRWSKRPHEVRAMDAEEEALQKLRAGARPAHERAIIALGDWFFEEWKGREA